MSFSLAYRTMLCRSCGFAFSTATSGRTSLCPVCGNDVLLPEPAAESGTDIEVQETALAAESLQSALTQCRSKHCPHFPNGDCCGHHHCSTVYPAAVEPVQPFYGITGRLAGWNRRGILSAAILAVILLSVGVGWRIVVEQKPDKTVSQHRTAVHSEIRHQKSSPENSGETAVSPAPVNPPVLTVAKPVPVPVPEISAPPAAVNYGFDTAENHTENHIEKKPQPPVSPEQLAEALPLPVPEKLPVPPQTTPQKAAQQTAEGFFSSDSAEKILENVQNLLASEPEKCLKGILYAVKRFREQNVPLPPDIYYLLGQSYASSSWGQAFPVNTMPVESISISPNSGWMLTQHQDSVQRIWNLSGGPQDGKKTLSESEPIRYVKLLFSPDQRLLLGGGEDGSIRIWNIVRQRPENEPILLRETVPGLRSIQLSPDGRWLVSFGTGGHQSEYSSNNTVFLWDLDRINSGILPSPILLSVEEQQINVVQFSPDSQMLAVGSQDAAIRLYDLAEKDVAGMPPQFLRGHQLGITALAFSPNGRTLASGSSDNTIILWNVNESVLNANSVLLSGHLGWVNSLVFDPSGSRLFSGSYDNTIRVWSMKGNPFTAAESCVVLRSGQGSIRELLLTSDGKHLISLGNDGSMRIQNADGTFDPKQSVVLRNRLLPISCAALTPDSRWLVFGYENLKNPAESGLRLWSLDTEELIKSASK